LQPPARRQLDLATDEDIAAELVTGAY